MILRQQSESQGLINTTTQFGPGGEYTKTTTNLSAIARINEGNQFARPRK